MFEQNGEQDLEIRLWHLMNLPETSLQPASSKLDMFNPPLRIGIWTYLSCREMLENPTTPALLFASNRDFISQKSSESKASNMIHG